MEKKAKEGGRRRKGTNAEGKVRRRRTRNEKIRWRETGWGKREAEKGVGYKGEGEGWRKRRLKLGKRKGEEK